MNEKPWTIIEPVTPARPQSLRMGFANPDWRLGHLHAWALGLARTEQGSKIHATKRKKDTGHRTIF